MAETKELQWARERFRAGERVAVAVSGGADSTALLMAMAGAREEIGLVLSAIHVHHGLRGEEADGDAAFVAELAGRLGVPLRIERVDTAGLAAERGKGIEEAARTLRYGVFHELLRAGEADSVATAHTLDDQAETVLLKLMRGAWTEGLSGIAPGLAVPGGRIVRPLLRVSRAAIIPWLTARGAGWREDSSNRDTAFTRNRVRQTLLPAMKEFQPRITEQLARLAAVAGDEEQWWEQELARVLPGLLLPGRPVRGGGRATSTRPGEAELAMELERLRGMHPALLRRVLRAAVARVGGELDFEHTELLISMTAAGVSAGGRRRRRDLGAGVVAECTPRELRLMRGTDADDAGAMAEVAIPVPGMVEAAEYGLRVRAEGTLAEGERLVLRTPRAGDHVWLRHGRSAKTVKDVLERLGMGAAERARQPVVAAGRRIVWLGQAPAEPPPGLTVAVEPMTEGSSPVNPR